jgi:hypothetical protein
MRRFLIVLAATSALAGSAYAQTPATTPATSGAAPSRVQIPADAIMADQLDDLNVRNAANETIGEIEDVAISQGRVAGYIISVGGFLGVGDRNILVDPSAITLSYNTNDKKWNAVMNATKEQLQALPAFTYEDRWKD